MAKKAAWMLILCAAALLAAGALIFRLHAPESVSAQTGCTLADVEGNYGFQFFGTVQTATDGPWATFAETGRWVVDGQGHYSGASQFSYGGHYFEHTFTGSVDVRPDCTAISTVPVDSLGFTELVAYWVIMRPHEDILLTSKTGVSAINGRALRMGPGSQLDRIEGMLRDVGRALGLVYPKVM